MLYIVLLQDTGGKNKSERLLVNTYTPIIFLLKRVDCLKAAWTASEKICFLATDIRLGENDNSLFFSFLLQGEKERAHLFLPFFPLIAALAYL